MRDQLSQHYFGLDIGTTMVRCVIGMATNGDPSQLAVIGHGSAPNMGMRKGSVVHVDDVVDSVMQAISEAERVSGVRITGATVNVNGSHVSGIDSQGVIAISAANREINADDRLRVEEAATIVQLPPNREIIQVFAKNYSVDGQDNIKDPVGMHGVRLEVDTHIVTASTPNMRNLDTVLSRAGFVSTHRTVSSLAAAEAVLTRQHKESGTLIIDMGASTTNMAIIEDGEVQHVAVLPIGGTHVTNDLAIGLRTELGIAELVKTKHASLVPNQAVRTVSVDYEARKYSFDAQDVQTIIEARIEELFEMVDKELRKANRSRKLPGGVVLTGGGAKIPGITTYAKDHLQLSVRVGSLQGIGGIVDTVNDATYTTAVGLMMLDMLLAPSAVGQAGSPGSSVFGLVDGLIKRFKK